MKRILSRMHGKMHRDNKGMSLVEVLCAVAILGLVSGIIGSVIVISTRTYNRGISETNIQQEAQLAANNIGDIVKDACSVIYGASGQKYIQNGEERDKEGKPYVASDTDPNEVKVGAAGVTELSILTNDKKQYTVKYYHDNYGSDGNPAEASLRKTLWYEIEDKKASTTSSLQLMAKDITAFTADTTKFKDNKTIELTITVNDGEREIPMNYTMTARNEAGEGVEYTPSSGDPAAIIIEENNIVLVPGEKYKVPFSAMGLSTVEWDSSTGLEGAISMVDSTAELIVPKNLTDTTEKTVLLKGNVDGVSAAIKVRFRKVTNVRVSHRVNTKDSVSGMKETVGTVYTFSANVSGSELAKNVAYDYDRDYPVETAQAVEWSYKLSLDGGSTDSAFYNWPSYTSDGSDGYNCTYSNDNADVINGVDGYIEVLETKENAQVPQLSLKLKKNLPAGFKLTVRATSKHAKGVNKAAGKEGCDSNYYAAGHGIDPKDIHYGETTIEPRETVVKQGLEFTLEPNESTSFKLDMMGGLTDNVTFQYHGATDLAPSAEGSAPNINDVGTVAVYHADIDEVELKIGNDELKDASSYTFTIDVLVNGVTKTTVTVHVRRIDKIWVEIVQDKEVPKTYDFRARINVDKPQPNKQATTNYLYDVIKENPDDADAKKIVAQTLSSKITWEFYDYNKSKTKPQYSDWAICEGGVGVKGTVTEKSDGFKEEREYYQLTKGLKNSVKPARIQIYTEEDRNKDIAEGNSRASEVKVGEWYIRQYPEVDLTLKKGSLPANTELRVTIEMLHSQGKNKSNSTYHNRQEWVVYASESIFGNRIYTDSEIVVVEPGQGTNSAAQSDEEIVIPIHSEGEDQDDKVVARMVATVEDSKKTRLSEYKNDDKTNPYCYTERTAKGNSEWYLGLVIDKEEKGNDDGFVTVKVEAYDKENTLLTQMNFKLAVRRVNNVELQIKDEVKFSDINEAGSTVTLEAYPTGEGGKGKKEGEGEVKEGTAYYGVQTKSDTDDYMGFDITIKDEDVDTSSTVCRWEKKDHGRYKSPFAMEWTMVINGRERALSEWTEYIEKPVPDTVPKEYKATVTFKLKKPLPSGAKIRAYSLHARGKAGNTKYNKSGKEYDEVYGELTIGGAYVVADGFQRADDWDFASNNKSTTNDSDIPDMRKYFTDAIYQSTQRTFFRYREAGTQWNASNKQYRIMDSDGERAAFFSGDFGSRLFLPNKEYELEIVNVVYGTGPQGQKVIYWPQDEKLLEAGNGWAEEGYQLWDGSWGYNMTSWEETTPGQWGTVTRSYEEVYELMKNTPQNPHNYLIPKSEIYFDKYVNQWESNFDTIDSIVKTIGSESNPKKLTHDVYYDRHFKVKIEPTSMNIDKTQAHFTAQVDKWENGQWVFMEALTRSNKLNEDKYKWFMNVSLPTADIYHVRSDASGKYRVRSTITGMQWAEITGGLFDTGNSRYKKYVVDSIDMFSTSDGSGIMYLQLN